MSLTINRLTPLALVLLASCGSPSGVKVIVGAQLDTIQNSVIVIRDGKFEAVGPQSSTPVPKGAEITSGYGKVVRGLIAPGEPADLVMRDAANNTTEKTMHNGEWLK